jgi:hypothetical protein
MINEIGKIFMSNGNEYKITYVDEKKKRITAEPYKVVPQINTPFPQLNSVTKKEFRRCRRI